MTWTRTIILVCVLTLGAWDVIADAVWGEPGTISEYVKSLGFRAPLFVFAAGFLACHFFGYLKD